MANASASRTLRGVLFLFLLEAPRAPGQKPDAPVEDIRPPIVGHQDPRLVQAVRKAVQEAASKLEAPECNEIFKDFRDQSGRTLQQNLDERGESGRDFLRWLIFFNGSSERACQNRTTLIATNPGSRFIHLCAEQFLKDSRGSEYAAILIIHEELHVLGLAENPPTSREITLRVISRCGAASAAPKS